MDSSASFFLWIWGFFSEKLFCLQNPFGRVSLELSSRTQGFCLSVYYFIYWKVWTVKLKLKSGRLKIYGSDKPSLLGRGDPICGNRIREGKEECDCGFQGDESCDKLDRNCCNGAPKNGGDEGCKFSKVAEMREPDRNKRCRLEIDFWMIFFVLPYQSCVI